MALISIFGLIEGHIEAVGPALKNSFVEVREARLAHMRKFTRRKLGELRRSGQYDESFLSTFRSVLMEVIEEVITPAPSERLSRNMLTVERWEDALHRVALGERTSRPLPDDLKATLNELGEVRNCLLHRMGRVDQKALDAFSAEAPWSTVSDLITIDLQHYRRYIAALWSYLEELQDRLRMLVGVDPHYDIRRWRESVPVGG